MEHKNKMVLEVESRSCNEGLARIAVAEIRPPWKIPGMSRFPGL